MIMVKSLPHILLSFNLLLGFVLLLDRLRDDKSKIKEYVEQVIPGYLPEQFRTHFRVSKETFECILLHLSNFPTLQKKTANRWKATNNSRKLPYDTAMVLRYT